MKGKNIQEASVEKVNVVNERKTWVIMTEWLSLIGTFIVCFLFLHNQIQDLGNKLDQTTISMNQRIDQTNIAMNIRIDQMSARIDQTDSRIDQQSHRMDQMYEAMMELIRKDK